jgi:ferritin
MSMHSSSIGLQGFTSWLRVQWQEELGHAMKLTEIVHDRGGRVTLQAVDKPPAEFKSPLDIFQQVLVHEQKVTALINRLYEIALKENDYATQVEVQWFIKEQIEEEKNATTILDQLKMAGESGASLIMVDRALAARAAR